MGNERTSFGLEQLSGFDLPWPRDNDTLSPSSVTGASHLEVRSTRSGEYERAEGFRLAAETLADALDRGGPGVEPLVYPFVYCWRHHIELQVKTVIVDSAELYGDHLPSWLNSTHSIAKLWNVAADYIAKSFPDDSSADPRTPKRIITQLAQIDPDGLTLRYARNRAGAPTLRNPIWLELRPFHTAMRNLSAYFDGVIAATDCLAENLPY